MDNKIILVCVISKFPKFLTYGKQYEAVRSLNYYHIVNDAEQKRKYKAEYFMTIDQYREKVLGEIGV